MSGETFEEVRREFSRRRLLQGMSVAALTVAAPPALGAASASAAEADEGGYDPGKATGLGFSEVPIGTTDEWVVARNHVGRVLLAWGDPIHAGDEAKDARTLTAAEQERRFGFNNDYIALVPFPFLNEDRGLLWVYMCAWSALYGVVTLESTGHCDPRVIESGQLFRATVLDWLGPLGLDEERERITEILDEELAERGPRDVIGTVGSSPRFP